MANKVTTFFKKLLDFDGVPTEKGGNRLSVRNYFMFPLGTIGRDFLYQLFNGYLITFILFTKTLTEAQFGSITFIIIAARIFDALNDPIMGGIVENTRSKWGRYKPWQLAGALLTGGVIIALFCTPIDGWEYIGLLAAGYILFSFTFTMNDISYWGMMPSLTSHPGDRNKLTSIAQICAGAGSGLVGLIVPIFTAGKLAELIGGGVSAYRYLAIGAAVLMIGFQLFTILGVKEKPLGADFQKTERMKFKDLFKTIFKNDQLLWCALVLLLASLGSGIVTGSLVYYFYFEFGYQGGWFTTFAIGMSVASTAFTVLYPWIAKKFGRKKALYVTFICQIVGFLLMMIFGLALPTGGYMSGDWWAKFVLMAIGYAVAGLGQGFYMILVVSIANTVEYNEWKTGKRNESIIFSLRPFTAKLSSALQQGAMSVICIVAGVLAFTNEISAAENAYNRGEIENLEEVVMGITNSVPKENKMIFLVCMCVVAIVLIGLALIIYAKKYKLDEATLEKMMEEIEERKAANGESEENQDGEVVEGEEGENVESAEGETAVADGEPTEDVTLEEVASDVSEESEIADTTAEVVEEQIVETPQQDETTEIAEEVKDEVTDTTDAPQDTTDAE